MVEGYCTKCKARREIADGVEETMNSGRVVYKGACDNCGEEVIKIVGENGNGDVSEKSTKAAAPSSESDNQASPQ